MTVRMTDALYKTVVISRIVIISVAVVTAIGPSISLCLTILHSM